DRGHTRSGERRVDPRHLSLEHVPEPVWPVAELELQARAEPELAAVEESEALVRELDLDPVGALERLLEPDAHDARPEVGRDGLAVEHDLEVRDVDAGERACHYAGPGEYRMPLSGSRYGSRGIVSWTAAGGRRGSSIWLAIAIGRQRAGSR